MGIRQSKPDMFVVMIRGDVEVCSMGIFSTLEHAMEFVPKMGNGRPVWIEKFKLDDPDFYEDESEYVVYKNIS